MKNVQWIVAIGFLAAMVFGITFALVYLPGSGGSTNGTTPPGPPMSENLPRLTFQSTLFPEAIGPYETEHKKPGSADFWFENTNKIPVRFGLEGKSCTCTNVEAFLAPSEAKNYRDRRVRTGFAAGVLGLAHPGSGAAQLLNLEKSLKSLPLKDRADDGYDVPPGSIGWVRLHWSGEKEGPQRYTAKLWMNHKHGQVLASLEARVVAWPRLYLKEPVLLAGTVDPRDLPLHLEIVCFSPVRSRFQIKAEVVALEQLKGGDPFVVGEPMPLAEEELRQLEDDPKLNHPALSGYRIPVVLKDRAGDVPFDMGPFRRLVRVIAPDLGIEPKLIPVVGTVQGDVQVGGREDNGRISLGTFDRSIGKSGEITLTTESDGPLLELVLSRVPEYLTVTFPKQPVLSSSGRKNWRIKVDVPPGKANGRLQRDDDPIYRDSAIYVRSLGVPPRLIRIPVEGNAENR